MFDSEAIEGMKSELPTYALGCCRRFSTTVRSQLTVEIPQCRHINVGKLINHPSSVAEERVFSLLQSPFGKQQEQSYIQLSVMMQYNYYKYPSFSHSILYEYFVFIECEVANLAGN